MKPTYLDTDTKFVLTGVSEPLLKAGVNENDEWVGFNGQPVKLATIAPVQKAVRQLKPGETYTIVVRRNGQDVTLTLPVQEREIIKRFAFTPDPQATPQQLQLREVWMKNL
jgi:C-terminal processing protease CtpA/Prc